MAGKTLYQKIWDAHVVDVDESGTALRHGLLSAKGLGASVRQTSHALPIEKQFSGGSRIGLFNQLPRSTIDACQLGRQAAEHMCERSRIVAWPRWPKWQQRLQLMQVVGVV